MTTREIKDVIIAADPAAKRYTSSKDGNPFTVWAEYRRIKPDGSPREDWGWAFEIDRYATQEEDPVAEAIEEALSENDRISFTREVAYETGSGYIRHIFDCEGI